jgi:predicted amidohydrolase YtcJ
MAEQDKPDQRGFSRKQFLAGGIAAGAAVGLGGAERSVAQPKESQGTGGGGAAAESEGKDLAFVNGKIHTMDPANRVVKSLTIRNGRFAEVGDGVAAEGARVVNLRGKTVVPGIIDAHTHIVLVGNRPGWHQPLEHVFTIPDAIAALQARSADVPAGEWITTIGPFSARQLKEQRLPNLTELDAVDRPVYIQAAQGGARTNSEGNAILEPQGVTVEDDGTIPSDGFGGGGTGTSLALRLLREQLLTPETRKRTSLESLQYFTRFGLTTHRDSGAFHSDEPAGGIATENTFTMHNPFLALNREGRMPARLRIDFLHQDNPESDLPTLTERLKNSFPFFGDDWLRTGGIGEFTSQPAGVPPLRAIAAAGWRAEDHALSLGAATNHIVNRETVHAEIPITDLRWVLSHIPGFNENLANRAHDMGMGVLVGWGPLRSATSSGPHYRLVFDHPITVGYHADGGDISLINPWLNFYTMITGNNLSGENFLGDQTLTRWETLWLATAANKWFINEDDVGSIEVGNHADLAVLDRDFFTVPDEDIRRIRSLLTVVGGKAVHDDGIL